MIEGILTGLTAALTIDNFFFLTLGCLVGTFIGMLPGLGPMARAGRPAFSNARSQTRDRRLRQLGTADCRTHICLIEISRGAEQ